MRDSHCRTTRLRLTQLEDRSTPAILPVSSLTDSGTGSLREAIETANSNPDPDTIYFTGAAVGGTVTLETSLNIPTSVPNVPQPAGPSAFFVITPITIEGTGETLMRKGPDVFRLFQVTAAGSLTLRNLTLTNGVAKGGDSFYGGGGAGLGGAIYNQGTLTILNSTLYGNTARGGGTTAGDASGGGGLGGPGSQSGGKPNGGVSANGGANGGFGGGGGVFNGVGGYGGFGGGGGGGGGGGAGGAGGFGGGGGGSILPANAGLGGFGGGSGGGGNIGGGGAGMGGAIFNQGGIVTISNSTLTQNTAEGGASTAQAGSGVGGGIVNLNGVLTLTNTTIAGNLVFPGTGPNGGASAGAFLSISGAAPEFYSGPPATATTTATVTVANSILANSIGADGIDVGNVQFGGTATISATGPNIVSGGVENSQGTGTGVPFTIAIPNLGTLANNGGPTRTMLPNPGSPAINAGSNAAAAGLIYDQRGPGFPRVSSGLVDLGAVEAPPLPQPLVVGGPLNGAAGVFAPAAGAYPAATSATVSPFGGAAVAVRTAVGDVNADGVPDIVLVTGPGTPIRLAVVSGKDNATVLVAPFDPFGGDFTGGGFVATGDIDRDGRAEFVVTPDRGGGPRVTIFSLLPSGQTRRANFFGIDDQNFRGGARAALGDVNADGTPDVVVAAGFGGGPRTAIFDGATVFGTPARLVADFFAFPGSDSTTLRNGSFVAAGDVTGDGFADLVFGGGPGGAPRVFILSGALVASGNVAAAYAAPVANFFVAGDAGDRGGARVAVTHADGDTRADVVVGSGEGRPGRVRVYLGKTFAGAGEPASPQNLDPFGAAPLTDGVFVG